MSKLVIEYEQNSPSALTQAAKIKAPFFGFVLLTTPQHWKFLAITHNAQGTIISLHYCRFTIVLLYTLSEKHTTIYEILIISNLLEY